MSKEKLLWFNRIKNEYDAIMKGYGSQGTREKPPTTLTDTIHAYLIFLGESVKHNDPTTETSVRVLICKLHYDHATTIYKYTDLHEWMQNVMRDCKAQDTCIQNTNSEHRASEPSTALIPSGPNQLQRIAISSTAHDDTDNPPEEIIITEPRYISSTHISPA